MLCMSDVFDRFRLAINSSHILYLLYRDMALQITDKHVNPMKILYKLDEILHENSILVADGGDFVGTAAYILRFQYSCSLLWCSNAV
jgi:thiamine pyrophosphate-dependent acetolactate synthase large subunit-like protein